MCVDSPAEHASWVAGAMELTLVVQHETGVRVAFARGELDLNTRELLRGCIPSVSLHIGPGELALDLGDLVFMDCGGYGGIVALRGAIEAQGGHLEVRNEVGQPARLLTLIGALEGAA